MRIDNNFNFVIINKIQYFTNMLMKKGFME
jgi:hypothetical protein